jgi:uncharacterized repeat protein (TIGR03803 family)
MLGALLLLLTVSAAAQTHTVLKSFGGFTDGSGGRSRAPLVRGGDGMLYGTTTGEFGASASGTVFRINPDGSDYTVLKWFTNSGPGSVEAAAPLNLVVAGNRLYGTSLGGHFNSGTVFKLNTDGTGFTILKHLDGPVTGAGPSSLMLSGDTLFGTTTQEGAEFLGGGTVFKLNTDGSGFSVIKSFVGFDITTPSSPSGGLLLLGDTLYGTTQFGGSGFYGTIFKVNTSGSSFSVLKNLGGVDGNYPRAALIEFGGELFGGTSSAGHFGGGTFFKLSPNGSGFTVLHHLPSGLGLGGNLQLSGNTFYGAMRGGLDEVSARTFRVNRDGSDFTVLHTNTFPEGISLDSGVMLDGDTLYGIASLGGIADLKTSFTDLGLGTIFKLNTNGSDFTVLKQFTSFASVTGREPLASGLVLSGNTLYGTTKLGGSSSVGTLYRVNTDGTDFAVVKQFTGNSTNGEAAQANGGLLQSGNTLYAMSSGGGTENRGTVFKVNTDGSDYAVLKSFTEADGGIPADAGLVMGNGSLYGTLSGHDGKVFKLNPDGGGYTVLANASNPRATLVLSGTTLYGTTAGGDVDSGTVFKVNPDGSSHVVLKVFNYDTDGGVSVAGLALSGNTLYGTTTYGGLGDKGTIFKINTDGSSFTVLKHFLGAPDDGENPFAALLISGNILYGTASLGGAFNGGIIFQLNTDGGDFTVLKHCNNSDGHGPTGNLVRDGNVLYGTTAGGGAMGFGTVFSLTLPGPPQLAIAHSAGNATLSWPTNAAGFALQSTTNLNHPANWIAVSPAPVVVGGNNSVTTPVLSSPTFYRLIQ